MAYLDAGSGELTLVLLHAFPFTSRMWEPQVDGLAGEGLRIVAPDLPAEASIDAMADSVATLLDQLGLGRVVIAGLSMGGYVTFAFLRRYRDRVAAVVLADTRAAADTEEVRDRRTRQQAQVAEEGTADLFDAMSQSLPGAYTREHRPEVVGRIRRLMDDVPASMVTAALEAMKHRADSTPDLAGIDVPVLVIVGEQDTLSPPEVAGETAAALPNGRLAVIPRTGHLSSLEDPDAFNSELRAFLDELA